ncbi:MAG: hypothetical protein DMG30_19970 [Acidobacteria bacterium]|nr:MAG: hypothetical protein DMG30_19970 [Acidobacteriota bacterium]
MTLQHPASIVRQFISGGVARRVLTGLVMGATAIAIVISPWGKRSGGHFNPAITFSFYRLGKVEFWDAWLYVIDRCSSEYTCQTRVWKIGRLGDHCVRTEWNR